MQENTNKVKYIAYACIVLAFASVFLMLEQIKLSNDLSKLLYERSKEEVSVTWINETSQTQNQSQIEAESQQVDIDNTQIDNSTPQGKTYIINKNSKKIHKEDCQYALNMKEENKQIIQTDDLNSYYLSGYTSCSKCKP